MDQKSLMRYVDSLMQDTIDQHSPGAAVVVYVDREPVLIQGYGAANLEYEMPIQGRTVFDSGSLAKQFTAYAVSLLIERNMLSLGEDIRTYLPEFPESSGKITVGHLLYHTSGLQEWGDILQIAGWRFGDEITMDDVRALIPRMNSRNFAPGEQFEYVNTGYTLLAEIISRIAGEPFHQWMDRNVFGSIGMKHSFFNDDLYKVVPGMAYSYRLADRGTYAKCRDYLRVAGSSSLYTTIEDLGQWLGHLLDGGSVVERMAVPGQLADGSVTNYAFGLFLGQHNKVQVLEHGGKYAGYRSALSFIPEKRIGVALLSNLESLKEWDIVRGIIEFLLNDSEEEQVAAQSGQPLRSVQHVPDQEISGHYLICEGHVAVIGIEDGQVFWKITGGPKFELVPHLQDNFIDQDGDPVVFYRNGDNRIDSMTLIWCGEEKRVQKIVPVSDGVEAYAGVYYNSGLNVAYRMIVREKELYAEHMKHGSMELFHYQRDHFSGEHYWFRSVQFVRENDQVIGCIVSSAIQAKNIYFTRIDRSILL
ncbi:beta-lactamase [Paenibacillus sp. FSL R7-277]|uniref:serine hydrolase domain-containing protein n=1 Tax=Paenibacillus sp. FSL R7-277 TaxID=1227352 RepID=UPI0003E21B61|nr:serine hydrolase domain-containing protein [Paenibacillus sp. FSL R7-277]ETT65446.1 beta-lactamase [Paenibacillus sp. FSL R7-277]